VVTREEIQQSLWSEATFVDFEHGINFSIKKIRGALADDAEKPRYIETLPRRGYRFIAEVQAGSNGKNGNNGKNGKNGSIAAAVIVEAPEVGKFTSELPANHENGDERRQPFGPDKRTATDTPRVAAAPGAREHGKEIAAASAAVLVLSSAVFWFATRRAPVQSPPPEWKLRQVTANPPESPVANGAISPDGKYVAYTDVNGMHLKLIETGETRLIPQPEALMGKTVEWRIAPEWFPDSTRFVADAHPAGQSPAFWSSEGSSIWLVSVLGGSPRKLRDDAIANSISPDGSLISFATNKGRLGDRETWLMGPGGENARKLFETDENSAIGALHWFPHGQRVWYENLNPDGAGPVTRDLSGGPVISILPPSLLKKAWEYTLLPDNRLLYLLAESGAVGNSCNYWASSLDERTGFPVSEPRQLTNWGGFCPVYTSVTGDGKKLAFLKWLGRNSVYVADLEENGTRLSNARRFAPSEGWDQPLDWTADSKEIVFVSNRNGHFEIFKKSLESETAELLVSGANDDAEARLSPDGSSLLYFVTTLENLRSSLQILRVPLSGGASQLVLTANPFSEFRCARSPSALCVLAERSADRKQFIMSAFDPWKGRGPELTRIDLQNEAKKFHWDLSADGTRICYTRNPQEPIEILTLDSHTTQTIRVKDWNNLESLDWDASGEGFYAADGVHGGMALLYVDLQGKAQFLQKIPGAGALYARTSPDGRHLAMHVMRIEGNIWTLENF